MATVIKRAPGGMPGWLVRERELQNVNAPPIYEGVAVRVRHAGNQQW